MDNRVAVITGASRGIGKQLAVDFAKAGYDVACLARSSAESPSRLPGTVDETAELVRARGRRALALAVDVREEEEVAAAAERVYRELGRCDVLVNNAAVAVPGRTLDLPARRWRLAVDVNLNGPYYLMYHFCPRMAEDGGGHVINISSSAAIMPRWGRISYTVTKAALESLTQGLAHELRDQNVAVNCIRLELRVWSEGFAATLDDADPRDFEDPVVMSDAVLWLVRQPTMYTGQILTMGELRAMGVVRPRTTMKAPDPAG
jgi:citronellol/citronellal dehydrogenase